MKKLERLRKLCAEYGTVLKGHGVVLTPNSPLDLITGLAKEIGES